MAITDALAAATAAITALLAQIKTSNCRLVYAPDIGSADNIVLTPTPAVSAYGADLLIMTDVAFPNATTTPKINVSGIGWLTITATDGTIVNPGAVAGKCLVGLSTANGGGYVAHLLFSTPASLAGALSIGRRHGSVLLKLASATSILLTPNNGNCLLVGGSLVQLPAAGIGAGVANVSVNGAPGASLAASTPYYVSLAVLAGVPTLRFWTAATYGHMPDTTAGNIGVEVISSAGAPMSTDTLVGLVYINASTQFSDADGARYLLSWFNRRRKSSKTAFSVNRVTTATYGSGFVELNAEIRNGFLSWSDEAVRWSLSGSCSNSGSSYNYMFSSVGFDGITPEPEACVLPPFYAANNPVPIGASDDKTGLSEIVPHYATLLGCVQGNTGTWFAASSLSAAQTGCEVMIEING